MIKWGCKIVHHKEACLVFLKIFVQHIWLSTFKLWKLWEGRDLQTLLPGTHCMNDYFSNSSMFSRPLPVEEGILHCECHSLPRTVLGNLECNASMCLCLLSIGDAVLYRFYWSILPCLGSHIKYTDVISICMFYSTSWFFVV